MATKKKKAKPVKKAAKKKPAKRAAATRRTAKPTLPAVVHWEVQSKDPAKQQQFFAELFGWQVDADNPMGYGMVAPQKDGIGGGIGSTEDAPRVTFYVHVPSIEQTLQRVESLGGQTVMPRTDLGMVIMGQFRDLEGNVIGLVEG